MPKQLPTPTPAGRYTYRRVVVAISEQIDARGFGAQKAAAAAVGLDESGFSHRLAGVKSRFTIEQLGALADHWEMPEGWPFVLPPRRRAK